MYQQRQVHENARVTRRLVTCDVYAGCVGKRLKVINILSLYKYTVYFILKYRFYYTGPLITQVYDGNTHARYPDN